MASVLQVATIKDQGGNANAIEIANSSANVTINNLAAGTIGSAVTIHDSLFKAGTGAFMARMTGASWTTVADQAIVGFNDDSTGDSYDTDNNFNTSTYKYTVPATGVYFFFYGIYTGNSDTANAFGFTTNNGEWDNQAEGANFTSIVSGPGGGADDHIQTATHIMPLTSGDTVWVSARTGSDLYPGHSYWGGCRLK
jgi:hypothetical protein